MGMALYAPTKESVAYQNPVGTGGVCLLARRGRKAIETYLFRPPQILERETGIEPATNGLGSRYSTIELLPPTATRLF
jgi:hypothetical protein